MNQHVQTAYTAAEFAAKFGGTKTAGGSAKKPGRGRVAGAKKGMNKIEKSYAEHLDKLRAANQIICWKFEHITLKLADDTRLTVDFAVQLADGEIVLRDTKVMNRKTGKTIVEEDAAVKLRVAATHSFFRIETAAWDGSQWIHKEICPQ